MRKFVFVLNNFNVKFRCWYMDFYIELDPMYIHNRSSTKNPKVEYKGFLVIKSAAKWKASVEWTHHKTEVWNLQRQLLLCVGVPFLLCESLSWGFGTHTQGIYIRHSKIKMASTGKRIKLGTAWISITIKIQINWVVKWLKCSSISIF